MTTIVACKELLPGQVLKDDAVVGLELRAGEGSKVWSLRYRTKAGRERRHRVGPFPTFGIEGARKVARGVLELVAMGRDPAAEIAEDRKPKPTVNDLCNLYIANYLGLMAERSEDGFVTYVDNGMPKQKADPQKLDIGRIDRYIRPGLGRMYVADVQQSDVQAFLNKVLFRQFPRIKKSRRAVPEYKKPQKPITPMAMNNVRKLLVQLFRLAATQPYGPMRRSDQDNPVRPTKANPERRRKRIAEPHELQAIARALDHYQAHYPRQIAALWVIWFTGARKNEIAKARVEDRRSGYGIWQGDRLVLQRHKTAGDVGEKTIHLPAQVTRILDSLPPDPSGYLFGECSLNWVWNKIRTAAGCPDLTIHDVRRTFLSIGLDLGYDIQKMGKLVGHTNVETTNGYMYLLQERQREMAQGVADGVERWMRPQALPPPVVPQLQDGQHDDQAGSSPE